MHGYTDLDGTAAKYKAVSLQNVTIDKSITLNNVFIFQQKALRAQNSWRTRPLMRRHSFDPDFKMRVESHPHGKPYFSVVTCLEFSNTALPDRDCLQISKTPLE